MELGECFVAVRLGPMRVDGVYLSPLREINLPEFNRLLDGVSGCVRRCSPHPTLVLRDFKA